MKPVSTFGFFKLSFFNKPACDRSIYTTIKKFGVRSIVEMGMGDGSRAENMISVAMKYSSTPGIRYTGIDMFDARENQALPLIEMHRRLNSESVKAQLVPGEPQTGIARIANSHVRTDLIVVSAEVCESDLEKCWSWMPRMLHSTSMVLVQRKPGGKFEALNRLQIEKLGDNRPDRTVKAA